MKRGTREFGHRPSRRQPVPSPEYDRRRAVLGDTPAMNAAVANLIDVVTRYGDHSPPVTGTAVHRQVRSYGPAVGRLRIYYDIVGDMGDIVILLDIEPANES